jgi:hypothetical protein
VAAAIALLSNVLDVVLGFLSGRYAAAGTDAERALFAAAGEAALARGEDFTPGSFVGLAGFSFLSVFTIWWTFVPVWHHGVFYLFGMTGGLLALMWFGLVSVKLFMLGRGLSPRANRPLDW